MYKKIELNDDFYKKIKKETEKYAGDQEMLNERAKKMREEDLKRIHKIEESYETLERFGAFL